MSKFSSGLWCWAVLKGASMKFCKFLVIFFLFSLTVHAATATFVKSDSTTQGNWAGVYGNDGRQFAQFNAAMPAYGSFLFSNILLYTWNAATTDPRALNTGAGRQATCWYNNPAMNLDVNLTDGNAHQVSLYFLDWDSASRAETVQVKDAVTGTVLDTRAISSFQNGVYESWSITGHVTFTFTRTAGANAVASGIFFDTPSAPSSGGGTTTTTPLSVSLGVVNTGGAVTGANFYRSTTSGTGYVKIGSVAAPNSLGTYVFTDTNVQHNSTYYYTVTFISAQGESGYGPQFPVQIN